VLFAWNFGVKTSALLIDQRLRCRCCGNSLPTSRMKISPSKNNALHNRIVPEMGYVSAYAIPFKYHCSIFVIHLDRYV